MRVIMQTIYASPKQTAQVGDNISLPPEEAKALIAKKYAIPAPSVASELAKIVKKTKETAEKIAPEKAVKG